MKNTTILLVLSLLTLTLVLSSRPASAVISECDIGKAELANLTFDEFHTKFNECTNLKFDMHSASEDVYVVLEKDFGDSTNQANCRDLTRTIGQTPCLDGTDVICTVKYEATYGNKYCKVNAAIESYLRFNQEEHDACVAQLQERKARCQYLAERDIDNMGVGVRREYLTQCTNHATVNYCDELCPSSYRANHNCHEDLPPVDRSSYERNDCANNVEVTPLDFDEVIAFACPAQDTYNTPNADYTTTSYIYYIDRAGDDDPEDFSYQGLINIGEDSPLETINVPEGRLNIKTSEWFQNCTISAYADDVTFQNIFINGITGTHFCIYGNDITFTGGMIGGANTGIFNLGHNSNITDSIVGGIWSIYTGSSGLNPQIDDVETDGEVYEGWDPPRKEYVDDDDSDDDGIPDNVDECPDQMEIYNTDGTPVDGDADGCDGRIDSDGDGFPDVTDNCPDTVNHTQRDSDGDKRGDDCDNCRAFYNPDQTDIEAQLCSDYDSDGIADFADNCPFAYDPTNTIANCAKFSSLNRAKKFGGCSIVSGAEGSAGYLLILIGLIPMLIRKRKF